MLKRVLALLMVLSLALPAFAESRYTDAVSAGEGFFAYVPSEAQAFGDEGSFGGAYSEPLLVYVDAAGNETKIAHGFITALQRRGLRAPLPDRRRRREGAGAGGQH